MLINIYHKETNKMFDQDELHEECGVFGVFGHNNAADLCYYGLHLSLIHI